MARLAGVSQNTVSLVLRGSPRISPTTAARVREAMRRLGYQPNAMARALRRRATSAVLVVLDQGLVRHHVATELLAGVVAGARAAGHAVLVQAVAADDPGPAVALYREQWAGGALVVATRIDDPVVAALAEAGCPTVSLLQPSRACPAERWVLTDDAQGTTEAVAHLVARGHRRLAFVGPVDHPNYHVQTRHRAAREAAARAGAELVVARVADWTFEEGRRAADGLLAGGPRPTAVVAASDRLAFGVLAAAEARGLSVPEDLAVVGFDDAEWSRYARPPLSTVSFPAYEAGRAGAERLLAPAPAGAGPVLLPTRFIPRASG